MFTGSCDRLNDEDVALADVFLDLDEDVLVAELEDLDATRRAAKVVANRLRQRRMGVAAKNAQLLVHSVASQGPVPSPPVLLDSQYTVKGGSTPRPPELLPMSKRNVISVQILSSFGPLPFPPLSISPRPFRF